MPFEIVPPGTHIDFIGKRHIAFAVSALILTAAAIAIPIRGVQLGIDFAGGTELRLVVADPAAVDEGQVRAVLAACGIPESSVVRITEAPGTASTDRGQPDFLIRYGDQVPGAAEDVGECPLRPEDEERLAELREATRSRTDRDLESDRIAFALVNAVGAVYPPLSVDYVGPRVGAELRRDGFQALSIATVLILLYIAFRFSARFAPGAVVALVHDVLITAGIFVIAGWEFDLRVLAALLAIMGYSLNDTIIIYDRIRENMELRTKHDLVEVLNLSVNQTLARTLLTSITTLGAVLSLLLLGGEVIRPFALAMTIGIVVGTYSSSFIAAPTLLMLERRFGGDGDAGARPKEQRTRADEPGAKTRGKPRSKSKKGKAARAGA